MNFKGQGTTEYLIILAIIIVIALVVVGVLGGFPSIASGITESQSKSYWQTASPLSFTDWTVTSSGARFVVENKGIDTITLTEITLNGTALSITDQNISAGSRITTAQSSNVTCTSGQAYSYNVAIAYGTADLNSKTFTGSRPVVGKCP